MLHTRKPDKNTLPFRNVNSTYWLSAVLSLFLLALQPLQTELLFHREHILAGEIWRYLTGNWVHTNYWHVALNLGGLWLLTWLVPQVVTLLNIILLSVGVSLGLWFFSPDLQWYVGFSGVLYGLFFMAGWQLLYQKDWLSAAVILLGICGKTLWDWHSGGQSYSSELIAAPVVYAAHVYGMFTGIVLVIWQYLRQR